MQVIQKYPQIIEEFIPYIQTELVPVFHKNLSPVPDSKIVINKSAQLSATLILDEKNKTTDCVTIEEFMNLVIERWATEIKYENDISNLKDEVLTVFSTLCPEDCNPGDLEFINQKSEIVLDQIFKITKIEEKRKAGDFCSGLLNGFDCELPTSIKEIAYYIIFQPFLTPYPVKLIPFAKKLLEPESSNKLNHKSIENKMEFIVALLKKYDSKIFLWDNHKILNDFVLTKENSFLQKKKICKFVSNGFFPKFAGKIPLCCKGIEVDMETEFMKRNVEHYETRIYILKLNNVKEEHLSNIFQLVTKLIYKIVLKTEKVSNKGLTILSSGLTNLIGISKLHLDFCHHSNFFTREGICSLFQCLGELANMKNLRLKILGNTNAINDKSLKILSKSLGCLTKLQALSLIFKEDKSCLTDNEFISFFDIFHRLQNLKQLSLDFSSGHNQISDNGIIFFSAVFRTMLSIQSLSLDFCGGEHKVTDVGIQNIAESFQNKIHLKVVHLNFSFGKNAVSEIGKQGVMDVFMNKKDVKIVMHI